MPNAGTQGILSSDNLQEDASSFDFMNQGISQQQQHQLPGLYPTQQIVNQPAPLQQSFSSQPMFQPQPPKDPPGYSFSRYNAIDQTGMCIRGAIRLPIISVMDLSSTA